MFKVEKRREKGRGEGVREGGKDRMEEKRKER